MSRIRLPLSALRWETSPRFRVLWLDEAVRWTREQAFPVDPQPLSRAEWARFFVSYRIDHPDDASAGIQAPVDGTVQFVRKDGRDLIVFFPLQPERLGMRAAGWFGPHANALVFHYADLNDNANCLAVVKSWIALNLLVNRRYLVEAEDAEGTRFNDLFASDLYTDITTFAEATESPRVEALAAERLSLWRGNHHLPVVVARGDPVAMPTGTLSVAWVHIPRDGVRPSLDGAWYWYDAHEVFSRMLQDHLFAEQVRPFEPAEMRPDLAVWYEQETLSDERISELAYIDTHIYNPPPASTPIPREVLFLRAGAPIQLYTSRSDTSWSISWLEADGMPAAHAPPAVPPGDHAELLFDWPERRVPLQVVVSVRAGAHSVAFQAVPDWLEAAKDKAEQVVADLRSLHAWLGQTMIPDGAGRWRLGHGEVRNVDALSLALIQKTIIDQVDRGFGRVASDALKAALRVDDDLEGTDRRNQILIAFQVREAWLETHQRELMDLFGMHLFEEVTSRGTEYAVVALGSVIQGMEATPRTRADMHRKLTGFLDDSPLPGHFDPPRPLMTAANFKSLWATFRSVRAPLASIMVRLVEADLFVRHINYISAVMFAPGEALAARVFTQSLRNRYVETFGDLREFAVSADGSDPSRVVVRYRPEGARLPADELRLIVNGLAIVGNLVAVIYDAIVFARDPSARNTANLAQSVLHLLNTGLDVAIQGERLAYRLSLTGHAPLDAARWQQLTAIRTVSSAAGLILNGVSIGYKLNDIAVAEERGHETQAAALTVALACSVGQVGLEVLVAGASLAWAPPITLALVVIGTIATVAAIVLDTTDLEDTLLNSIFGDRYESLAPHPIDARPFMRLDTDNQRADWWRTPSLQLSHLRAYISPLNAEFYRSSRAVVVELVIEATPAFASWGSQVWVQLWRRGQPVSDRVQRTFTFELEDVAGERSITVPAVLGGNAGVRSERLADGRIHFFVTLHGTPAFNPSYDVDRATIAVSSVPAPHVTRAPDRVVGLAPEMLAALEANQFGMMFLQLEDRT